MLINFIETIGADIEQRHKEFIESVVVEVESHLGIDIRQRNREEEEARRERLRQNREEGNK